MNTMASTGRPARWLGAADFGLAPEWRLRFVPVGSHLEPVPGVVAVDVGGDVRPGIVDHHGGRAKVRCSAEAVYKHPECVHAHLLGPWLATADVTRRAEARSWAPTILAHVDPDWDAVVAIALAMELVRDGDFSAWAGALVEYAALVDQGRMHLDAADPDALFAPHLAYLMLQNEKGYTDEQRVLLGLRMIGAVVEAAEVAWSASSSRGPRSAEQLSSGPARGVWQQIPELAPLRDALVADRAAYERDLLGAEFPDVRLPAADGGPAIAVPACIFTEPSASRLNKYWVRAAGRPFFVCPYEGQGVPSPTGVFSRVVLSLDPEWSRGDRKPCLRGLGVRLERAEVAHRVATQGADERGGRPRYDDGSCTNDDPWYDGRGHEFTIVDAPRKGTLLPYEHVVHLATSGSFWEIPLEHATLTVVDSMGRTSRELPTGAKPPAALPGMAPALVAWLTDSYEVPAAVPELSGRLAQRFSPAATIRWSPRGLSHPVRVVRYTALQGATLEDLVALRGEAVSTSSDAVFAVSLKTGAHFSGEAYEADLVRRLGGGPLDQGRLDLAGGQVVLTNGAALVIHNVSCRDVVFSDEAAELFLYVVLLRAALSTTSSRIGRLLSAERARGLDRRGARKLRTDYLFFQARYYSLEATRDPDLQRLFLRLCETLSVRDRRQDVQEELDRLADLEERQADQRVQSILFFLSIFGVVQCILGYFQMPSDRGLAVGISAITLAALLGLYAWFTRASRSLSDDRVEKR